MTEKKYLHTRYIIHHCILRVLIIGPFGVLSAAAEAIQKIADKGCDKLDKILPNPYVQEMVEWNKLSKKEQRRLDRSSFIKRQVQNEQK